MGISLLTGSGSHPFKVEIRVRVPLSLQVRIPDRWVKLALELWVIPEINHITLAEGDIIECALRKTFHRL